MATSSALLRLSPELWHQIYGFALINSGETIDITDKVDGYSQPISPPGL